MKIHFTFSAFLVLSTLNPQPSTLFAQGSLTPPGPPAMTMKTLNQVEPRTDVATLPFDSSNQYIITQPGSYYLSGNINGVSGKNAISIQADDVDIDLNGFAMVGAGGGFSASAIYLPSTQKNLCLHNGTIQGWGSTAVLMFGTTASRIENLRISDSGGSGVLVGDDSTVAKCTVTNSAAYGIQVGTGGAVLDSIVDVANNGISTGDKSSVSGSIARACVNAGFVMGGDCEATQCRALNNGSYGFSSGVNGVFTDCLAKGNLNHGFNLSDGSKLTGCAAATNTGGSTDGILCQNNCVIHNCTATSNGATGISINLSGSIANCSARSNGSNGITINGRGVIIGCAADSNTGFGLGCTSSCIIKDCTATNNTADGISAGNQNELIGNVCNGNGPPASTTISGIHVTSSTNRIDGNYVIGNHGHGIKADAGGNVIVRNTATSFGAAGNTNYELAANNLVGPIVLMPSSVAISGLTGGSGLGSTDPSANFSSP